MRKKLKTSLAKLFTVGALVFATLLGVIAFLYPFFLPPRKAGFGMGLEHSQDAFFVFLLLISLILIITFADVIGGASTSKEVALLGVLVAINTTLRFVPLPLGGSAIFFLIILGGYMWGARFGFLLGSLSILVSSFWAGGFGPWVPFQMIVAGWVGLTASFLSPLRERLKKGWKILEVLLLALFGFLWGFLFGAVMNLWFWPYLGGTSLSLIGASTSFLEILKRYGAFYAATSLVWDVGRAIVNFLLILSLGAPLLKILTRFKRRFSVELL